MRYSKTNDWNQEVAQSKQKLTTPKKSQPYYDWNESVKRSKQTWNIQPNDYSSIIANIDRMDGIQFEEYMEQYFRRKGYQTYRTPASGDWGIDIIISTSTERIGIQLKRYSKKVSLRAVQEVLGGFEHYNLTKGMVITNNYFQLSAITLARESSKPIILWDREVLIKNLQS